MSNKKQFPEFDKKVESRKWKTFQIEYWVSKVEIEIEKSL